MNKKQTFVALGVILLILVAGYIWSRQGEVKEPENKTVTTQRVETKQVDSNSQEQLTTKEEKMQEETTSASELKKEIIKEGTGPEAKTGDTVSVHYTGTFLDGKKFDSSVDRGTPFEFTVGAGMVIKGWDEGVAGMKVGEKAKFTIPSDLAYGPNGYPPVIPGGATLVFEIELLEIK